MKQRMTHRVPFLVAGAVVFMALVLALINFGFGTARPVAAQQFAGLPNDGRINIVHHFGGDALYCVTSNKLATYNLPDVENGGGFRLLNAQGNELWFLPGADVTKAIGQAKMTPGQGVLVGQGQGTYGPVELYVFVDGNGAINFQFTGMDEWGKSNMMPFQNCGPVGPIPSPGSHTGNACSGIETADFDSKTFIDCYNKTCPNIPVESGEQCFCSAFPNSLVCNGPS